MPSNKDPFEGFSLNDDTETFFGIGENKKEERTSINKVLDDIKKDEEVEDDTTDSSTKVDSTKKDEVEDKDKEEEDLKFFDGDEDNTTEKVEDKTKDSNNKNKKTKVESKDDKLSKEKDNDKSDDSDVDDSKFYGTLAKELKDNNIFSSIELPDKEDLTYEEFIELQDAEIEARVDESFESFFENLDEDAKAFLRFKREGGNTHDFFSVIANDISDVEFDDENEEQHENIVKFYLANDGKDNEEIEEQLQWLKDGGKLKNTAKKYFDNIKKTRKANQEAIEKQASENEKRRQAGIKKFNDTVGKVISESDKIGSFTINSKEKKSLQEFITKPKIKVGKNSYVPEFNIGLNQILNPKTEEDIKKLVILGKLIYNNFDISDVVLSTNTEKVNKARERLKEVRRTGRATSSTNTKERSLSDFF